MAEFSEIERKFLVCDGWHPTGDAVRIVQGYIAEDEHVAVRVRLKGDVAYLTVKAALDAISRREFEYEIPLNDARVLLNEVCPRPPIEKRRYEIVHGGATWEVDVFEGANAGLIVAEIELDAPDQAIEGPEWLGPEVTGDPRFYNARLYREPFAEWGITYEALVDSLNR